MVKNNKKGKLLKTFWVEDEKEYKKLKEALSQGINDEVLDAIYDIYLRGDL